MIAGKVWRARALIARAVWQARAAVETGIGDARIAQVELALRPGEGLQAVAGEVTIDEIVTCTAIPGERGQEDQKKRHVVHVMLARRTPKHSSKAMNDE